MATIVDLVIVLDAISVAIAFTVGASRIFFALGRDRLLPTRSRARRATTRRWAGNLVVGRRWRRRARVGRADELRRRRCSSPTRSRPSRSPPPPARYLVEAIYVILALFALRPRVAGRARRAVVEGAGDPGRPGHAAAGLQGLAGPVAQYPEQPRHHLGAGAPSASSPSGTPTSRCAAPTASGTRASHAIEHEGVPPLDETLQFEPTPSDSAPAAQGGLGPRWPSRSSPARRTCAPPCRPRSRRCA